MKTSPLLLALAVLISACENPLPTDPLSGDSRRIAEPPNPAFSMYDPGYGHGTTVRRSTGANFTGNEPWLTDTEFDFLADVTGDGAADAVRIANSVVVRRAAPFLRTFGAEETWLGTNGIFSSHSYFADLNGDGKQDLIAVMNYGKTILVSASTGSGFAAPTQWLSASSAITGTKGTFFADMNNDRKADAIAVNDNSIMVRLSNGAGFLAGETWLSGVAHYGSKGTYLEDVTGDGRADAIAVMDHGVIVRPVIQLALNGIPIQKWKLGEARNWTGGPYYGNPAVSWRWVYFADVNNDKKMDAIAVNEYGVTVRRSTGSAFSSNEAWTTDPYYGHNCSDNNFFADVTDDGRADALVVNIPNPVCVN